MAEMKNNHDSQQMLEMIARAQCDETVKATLIAIVSDLQRKQQVIDDQADEIRQLRNDVTDLEVRISEQERYSSKDCLIIENAQLNVSNCEDLRVSLCQFFMRYLDYKVTPSCIKACHKLSKGGRGYPPTVIAKFVYFDDKNEIYARRSLLGKTVNPTNKRPIFLKERLPKRDLEIYKQAINNKCIATTQNCQVKIFCQDNDGNKVSVPVKSLKALEEMVHRAVKRKGRTAQEARDVPLQNYSHENYLKRFRDESEEQFERTEIDGSTAGELKKANVNSTPPSISSSIVINE